MSTPRCLSLSSAIFSRQSQWQASSAVIIRDSSKRAAEIVLAINPIQLSQVYILMPCNRIFLLALWIVLVDRTAGLVCRCKAGGISICLLLRSRLHGPFEPYKTVGGASTIN